ncbi:MAG TPA: DUF5684 domain-containing protein [Candidatus Moranbacteria bacterium]|nr:DUF5684 domain-containing protein [Candidatus Moranbacteria bacterium]
MGNDYSTYGNYPDYSTTVDPAAAAGAMAIFGGMLLFMVVIFLVFYVYMAVCLMKMAHKTNTPNAWFAWIPILNMILMLQVAQKPIWWIILFFIPLVNIIMCILVWMAVAKALGKPEWVGVLMIVPIANIIVPGYLAFSGSSAPSQPSV